MSEDRITISTQFEKLVSEVFSFLATEYGFERFASKDSFTSASFGGEVSIFFGNKSFGKKGSSAKSVGKK